MFLNSLAAQAAGASTSSSLQMLLPLALVFGVMYFLIIRPQNKRMKDQQNMQSSIKIGDSVVTSGGLIGRVTKLEDKEVHVDFNRAGQPIRVLRSAVVGIADQPNKAKTMTQSTSANTKKINEPVEQAPEKAAPQKPRVRSPMNRGRAGSNNRRPASTPNAPKKTEE